MVEIKYGKTEEAYESYTEVLKQIIKTNGFTSILDVGGGAHPMFSLEYIISERLDYTVLDISQEELARAPHQYNKCLMDIAAANVSFERTFDFVFSRFMAEHVNDAAQLHANIYNALRPGGVAVHFFPTLYAIPFVVNWLLPNWMATQFLNEERRAKGKFPAYYKWCVGPNPKSVRRFTELGYDVIEYSGFFGHGYYDSVPLLRKIHGWVREKVLKYRIGTFTSFAWIILRKPSSASTGKGFPQDGPVKPHAL